MNTAETSPRDRTDSQDLIPRAGDPLPTGEDKTRSVQAMFDVIAPRYDLVNRVMTFRMDVGWRRRTVSALGLPPGCSVLDLACGTGDLAADLEDRGLFPIGVDLSFGMLAAAPRPFARLQADGAALPLPDASVDGATCGFALRNFIDLTATFAELARIVRPGGRIALLEVATPPNPVLRFGHGIYFGQVVPTDRRAALRRQRLPLPAPVGRLPARARRDALDARARSASATCDGRCCRSASRS